MDAVMREVDAIKLQQVVEMEMGKKLCHWNEDSYFSLYIQSVTEVVTRILRSTLGAQFHKHLEHHEQLRGLGEVKHDSK